MMQDRRLVMLKEILWPYAREIYYTFAWLEPTRIDVFADLWSTYVEGLHHCSRKIEVFCMVELSKKYAREWVALNKGGL